MFFLSLAFIYLFFFNLLNFYPVTRFLVTPLLVTRYCVTLFSNKLYELCTIKPKGGFYSHEVLNSIYQVLTKFHKVCTKSLFCFQKK